MTSYSGYTGLTEYHSDTTDGSGDVTLTLAETPTTVNHIAVFSPDATYFPKVQSVGTNEVVVRFYTIDYDLLTIDRLPENLPGGVTATDAAFDTDGSTGVITIADGTWARRFDHVHSVGSQYEHSHSLPSNTAVTETNIAWTAATSTAVECVVIYATPAL